MAKAIPCAKVKPKVIPNSKIFPNSISAVIVYACPSPTLMNSKTNTAASAPMGSINIPSHFKTVEMSFFNGIFLKIGVITVGPVTIINAENKKEICQVFLEDEQNVLMYDNQYARTLCTNACECTQTCTNVCEYITLFAA